jgi:hypothetical protein
VTLRLAQSLNGLRANQPALREGKYLPLPQPGAPDVLTFARVTDVPSEVVVVVANASDRPFDGRVFTPYSYLFDSLKLRDLLEQEEGVQVAAGSIRVKLGAWGIGLFSPEASVPGYSYFR